MSVKILNVFYGADNLPYKDRARSVHFPIVGNAFQGASDTTEIHFYFDRIGEPNASWVAVTKLPNGKIGSKVLSVDFDSELNENYAVLSLSSFYTQYKGDLYISLQGYQSGATFEYDQDDNVYKIYGTPIIQATGSVKLSIAYATQFVGSGEEENTDLQSLLALLGTKLNISSGIVVLGNIANSDLSGYENGQIIYDILTKQYYVKTSESPYYELAENQSGLLGSTRTLVRYISELGAITLQELYNLNNHKQFILGYHNNSTGNTIDYLVQFQLSSGSLYGVRATRLSDLHSYYANISQLSLSNNFSALISDTYKDNIVANNDLVNYTKNYVRHIEIDSTLTAQEVYDTIGSDLRVFSYCVDDVMYFAMFVTTSNNEKALVVFNETHSFETESFALNSLFMNDIANEKLRYSSVPIVTITQAMTTLTTSQMEILNQDNSCISFNGRTYFKAHDSGASIEFVCVDYDNAQQLTHHQLTKYEISVNKTTRQTNSFSEFLNVYDKAQIDSKVSTIYSDLGASIDLSIDSNFDLVVKLLNQNGEVLAASDVDLPLEQIVTSAIYYDTYTYGGVTHNNVIVIELATTSEPTIIPVGQLVSGLEKEAFIQVDNIGTPLTSDQLTIADLPNARIKYGNNYFIKANDNGTNIVFANLLIGISESSGVYTLEKQVLTVTKSSGQMVTTTSYTIFYSKDQVDTLLSAKANASDVYTKAESDATFRTENQVDTQINTKISGLSRTNLIEDYEENKQYDYKYIVTQDGELVMRLTEIE